MISTLPPDTSAWLRDDVVDKARANYEVPVTHVVSHRVATPALDH